MEDIFNLFLPVLLSKLLRNLLRLENTRILVKAVAHTLNSFSSSTVVSVSIIVR